MNRFTIAAASAIAGVVVGWILVGKEIEKGNITFSESTKETPTDNTDNNTNNTK